MDALSEKVGLTIDWSCENLIPYFKQLCDHLVNYELVTSIVWTVIGILCIITAFVIYKYELNEWKCKNKMTDRLLLESDVIKTIDKHTSDNNQLDNDISCIPEK